MRYRYINIFTLSLAAWAIILAMVFTCNAVAGTRYEGVDSTDGRYWEKWRDVDAHETRYTPRPEAWEMVRVDTCGWRYPTQTV